MTTDLTIPDQIYDPQQLFDVSGRKVLITGGSRGLGRATALAYAAAGAEVCVVARSEAGLDQTLKLSDGLAGTVVAKAADLSERDAAQVVVEFAETEMSGLDVLINNAAADFVASIEDTDDDTWGMLMNLNVDSCFRTCRAASPLLQASGRGKVINVGSVMSTVAVRDNTGYVTSKTALVGFTRSLALEWARKNVQVNCLAPGFVKTEMTEEAWSDPAVNKSVLRRTPVGRWADTTDIVGAMLFLGSSASNFMTGSVLTIDGGWAAQ